MSLNESMVVKNGSTFDDRAQVDAPVMMTINTRKAIMYRYSIESSTWIDDDMENDE
jgi:hypothetical protein